MNRTIKFRGQTLGGEWVCGNLAIISKKTDHIQVGYYISNTVGRPFAYDVRPETVGQFTENVDKNGVEIYEGDISRDEFSVDDEHGVDERIYSVCVWIKEWSRFAWLTTGELPDYEDNGISALDSSMQETFGVFDYESNKTTVCGNRFQNPELLSN